MPGWPECTRWPLERLAGSFVDSRMHWSIYQSQRYETTDSHRGERAQRSCSKGVYLVFFFHWYFRSTFIRAQLIRVCNNYYLVRTALRPAMERSSDNDDAQNVFFFSTFFLYLIAIYLYLPQVVPFSVMYTDLCADFGPPSWRSD